MLLELLEPPAFQLELDGYPVMAARVKLDHTERADAEPIVFVNSFSKRLLYLKSYWTDEQDVCNGRPLGISEKEVREILSEMGLEVSWLERKVEFEDELYYFPVIRAREVLERYGWWQVEVTTDVDYEAQ